MTKRDDDASQTDMEVGMTTAERRRRRRRGGGLRVPSDNVPRRSSTAPPVAPVPEDPALAMSIAYSFTNEPSEPVPRVDIDGRTYEGTIPTFEPSQHEAAPTVIDPPTAVESQDFEMKTREMSAVDLEALGLNESMIASTLRMPRVEARASSPNIEVEPELIAPRTKTPRAATEPPPIPPQVPRPPILPSKPEITPPSVPAVQVPIPTTIEASSITPVSVSSVETSSAAADMWGEPSEVRAVQVDVDVDVDMGSDDGGASTLDTPLEPDADGNAKTRQLDAVAPAAEPAADTKESDKDKRQRRERIKTVALSDEDLEEVREAYRQQSQMRAQSESVPTVVVAEESSAEPMSVPDIYIHELAERADASTDGDDTEAPAVEAKATPPTPPPRPSKSSGLHPVTPASAEGQPRSRPPSIPPSSSPQPPPTPHAPPPPPPAAVAKPPAPPVAAKKPAPTPLPKPEKPQRGKPWFVDLFDEDYLRTLPFLTPQATQAEAEFVIDAMGLSPGAQVLDVGCGYGRHAMELAARGFHVVGLDLSTPLLVRGGEEAHRRGLTINFIRGDMRELDFDAQFDGAYCLFSTFGYFDDETNKKTASNIARALKPGGRVMFEILNRDYVIADLPTRVWWEGEGCVVLEEVELNYFSSRIQVNRSVVFDDGRQLEQEISVRAYSLHEVGKLMHSAGFRVLEVSGGYHTRGRFFGNQSRHIIVLAERKDPSAT